MENRKIIYWQIKAKNNPFLVLPGRCYGCSENELNEMHKRIGHLNQKSGSEKYIAVPVYAAQK